MAFVRLSRGLCLVKYVSTLRSTVTIPKRRPLFGLQVSCFASESAEKNLKKMTEKDWEERLTPEQYVVCREKGTEQPFSGKYYTHKEEGLYVCVACKSELFSSKTKYDSGSGWPSFYDVIGSNSAPNVITRPDTSTGTLRTEVLCKKCDAHLGHRFPDGPQPTGTRYCINSVALNFTPKKMS